MTTLSPLRDGRITGSRIGAILGVNRYSKPADVLREMVRAHFGDDPEFTGNETTAFGQQHEDDAITAYEQDYGVMVHGGQDIILHPVHDFLAVTPDGLIGDDGMIEVKCPPRARYTHISEKPDYEAQIRLQLECTGRAWCDFVVWRDGQPLAVSRVDHDPAWLPTVLPTLTAFMDDYRATIANPDLAAPHRAALERTDTAWASAAARYLELVAHRDALDEQVSAARDVLLGLAGDKPSQGCGVAVQRTERRGSVDYAKAIKKHLPDLDLEDFRKPSSTVYSIRGTA